MSSRKNGNKTQTTTTTTTKTISSTKPPTSTILRGKRNNESNVDRNKTRKEEKIMKTTKKPTNEDETIKKTTSTRRPVIKTKETIKKTPQLNVGRKLATTTTTQNHKPQTPPSNRVTKTQFFPNKSMYSQALNRKQNDNKKIIIRESPKTSSVIIDKNRDIISPDSSSISERPRTATLRKGSIVNHNIAGPEIPKAPPQSTKSIDVTEEEEEKYDDDDFDSYESDFDEYRSSDSTTINISEISSGTDTTSGEEDDDQEEQKSNQKCSTTDDEKKLDSGTYELPEFKQKKLLLDNIKEIIENENNTITTTTTTNNNNFGSLSDEGFEDAKSLQFINFLGAQQKYQKRKTNEMKRKRGEEILTMIKLDIYNFTLLDLPSVPYDEFIKTFGKQNTIQTSTQTGDEYLCEEIQTDQICYEDKWTQYPPVFQQINPKSENFWQLYKANYLGIGGGSIVQTTKEIPDHYNLNNLNRFIINAGNLILNLQIENDRKFYEESHASHNLPPFSQGYLLYNTKTIEILNGRSIRNACFADDRILTVHSRRNDDDDDDDDQRSIVCVWRIGNVKVPECLLCVFGETTCCTASLETLNLVFGGLDNGTIVVWDIKEDNSFHAGVGVEVENNGDFQLRTPTFTTACESHHSSWHDARIISVVVLSKIRLNDELFERKTSMEICSLDENGLLIIWGVIKKNQQINIDNHGLAYWGNVILTINRKICLQQFYSEMNDFKCTDLLINHLDPIHLYISTNYGFICHCLTNNAKPKVRKFLPKSLFQSNINCLELCPFSSNYFLAGFDNGNANFYVNHIEQPLMVLSDKDCIIGKSNIELIQWSHNRPLIFYTKDITNTIHVWNLNISDMFPVNSIPFKKDLRIVSMKLSPITSKNDNIEDTYMMIATESGSIYLYLLGSGHEQTPVKQYEDDKRNFFNYIDRYV